LFPLPGVRVWRSSLVHPPSFRLGRSVALPNFLPSSFPRNTASKSARWLILFECFCWIPRSFPTPFSFFCFSGLLRLRVFPLASFLLGSRRLESCFYSPGDSIGCLVGRPWLFGVPSLTQFAALRVDDNCLFFQNAVPRSFLTFSSSSPHRTIKFRGGRVVDFCFQSRSRSRYAFSLDARASIRPIPFICH